MRARLEDARRRRQIRLGGAIVAVIVVAFVAYRLLQPSPEETFRTAIEEGFPVRGSAAVHLRTSLAPGTGLEDVSVDGEGSYDRDSATADITFDFSAVPNGGGALGTLEDVPTVYEGSSFYAHMPHLARFLEVDDPWIKFGTAQTSLGYGADIGLFHVLAQANPVLILETVENGAGSITTGSDDSLDGESAGHVLFEVDVTEAREDAPREIAQTLNLLGKGFGASTGRGEAWIIDGEVARVQVTYDMLIGRGAPTRSEVAFAVDLETSETTVNITGPDPGSIVDLEDIAKERDRGN